MSCGAESTSSGRQRLMWTITTKFSPQSTDTPVAAFVPRGGSGSVWSMPTTRWIHLCVQATMPGKLAWMTPRKKNKISGQFLASYHKNPAFNTNIHVRPMILGVQTQYATISSVALLQSACRRMNKTNPFLNLLSLLQTLQSMVIREVYRILIFHA